MTRDTTPAPLLARQKRYGVDAESIRRARAWVQELRDTGYLTPHQITEAAKSPEQREAERLQRLDEITAYYRDLTATIERDHDLFTRGAHQPRLITD